MFHVWDLDDDGHWYCSSNLDKVHSGSVWRVTWAHPEFGQVLATCSFDRTAAVWEEQQTPDGTQTHWIKRSNLVDSRTSVTDVKFAPKHQGLQLAACSIDGILRIYEAPDVMNLSQWSLQHEINTKLNCSCVSWNTSRMDPPMLAVGSDDSNPSAGGKVQLYEYNDSNRRWNKVETIVSVTDPVHDLSFAPNLGRSYHILAIATKDLKIISIKPMRRDVVLSGQSVVSKPEMRQVAEFGDHESQVWRVGWNITGTVLASSGDDGCVRLWKANYLDNWKCISVLKGDGSKPETDKSFPLPSMSNNQNIPGSSGVKYFKVAAVATTNQFVCH